MYHNSLQAQLDVTELLLKFLSVDFINDVHLSKNHITYSCQLTYAIVLLPTDVSILTAVMDIPELPDVIDSLVKTYQSKFL